MPRETRIAAAMPMITLPLKRPCDDGDGVEGFRNGTVATPTRAALRFSASSAISRPASVGLGNHA